jgi:hypothetical protein
MTGSRQTLLQRFVLDAAPRFTKAGEEAIHRAAYAADEAPRSAHVELEAYYALCDCARGWAILGLRRIRLVDYANFLDRTRILSVDGAIEAGMTISTALSALESEPFVSGLEPFVRSTQTVLHEVHKSLDIAVATDDPEAERPNLRAGTAAAARAFVAARLFLTSPADAARETAQAMRSAAALAHLR